MEQTEGVSSVVRGLMGSGEETSPGCSRVALVQTSSHQKQTGQCCINLIETAPPWAQ